MEQPLLSNEQSAQLAGVSIDTIEKYCQIGLLVPEMRDNKPFFKEADIKSLFYTKSNFGSFAQGASSQAASSQAAAEQSTTEAAIETEAADSTAASDALEAAAGTAPVTSPDQATSPDRVDSPATKEFTEREAQLLEMNQTLREQIELLREERDWLRQRIEHLETRSEREQMLLLAESETVRRLVKTESLTEKLLNFRLPWFSNLNDQSLKDQRK